jgi:hypothetical protein
MSNIINISSKMGQAPAQIMWGTNLITVNNGVKAVLEFEETINEGTTDAMIRAIKKAIKSSSEKVDIDKMPMSDFQVLSIAVMAAMQGRSYEEVETSFQRALD